MMKKRTCVKKLTKPFRRTKMLSLIVAMDENDAIGFNNQIPWKSKKDMAYFKRTTLGHTVVMGRKTHESIGRLLPDRVNVVLSRDQNYRPLHPEVVVMDDINFVFADRFVDNSHTFIIGGAELYELFLPYAERVYATIIPGKYEADTHFPAVVVSEWAQVSNDVEYEEGLGLINYKVFERVSNIEYTTEETDNNG
jgi:dihydrofolate reductase